MRKLATKYLEPGLPAGMDIHAVLGLELFAAPRLLRSYFWGREREGHTVVTMQNSQKSHWVRDVSVDSFL